MVAHTSISGSKMLKIFEMKSCSEVLLSFSFETLSSLLIEKIPSCSYQDIVISRLTGLFQQWVNIVRNLDSLFLEGFFFPPEVVFCDGSVIADELTLSVLFLSRKSRKLVW